MTLYQKLKAFELDALLHHLLMLVFIVEPQCPKPLESFLNMTLIRAEIGRKRSTCGHEILSVASFDKGCPAKLFDLLLDGFDIMIDLAKDLLSLIDCLAGKSGQNVK